MPSTIAANRSTPVAMNENSSRTNVLCRLAAKDHSHHVVAEKAVTSLHGDGQELCLVPQVLYEYWVVATRPTAENGINMTTATADKVIDLWSELFTILRDERGIFSNWRHLVRTYGVQGKSAHDARLVAAMQRHAVTQLLTFNIADFQRYREITLLDPQSVAAR
jgi:predicted nucleic acid-binding protein